jgi:polysaccharide biosynthesis transport protein
MNPKQTAPSSPGIALSDIYHIIFRHKWLILIISTLALIAAVLVWMLFPNPYMSEAKLLIKYVKEVKPPDQTTGDSQVTSPDSRGDNIINSEIEILTSLDLVNTVVEALTPAKILAKAGGGTNKFEAAYLIKKGLAAGVTNKSDVIEVILSHPDPDMVQPILGQIIETYLKRHAEIHRPDFNESLIRDSDTVKGKLQETETALRDAKAKAGVISLEDSKKTLGDMTAKIQQAIYDTQAEWASCLQMIKARRDMLPPSAVSSVPTNKVSSSDSVAEIAPVKDQADYRRICEQLGGLQAAEEELLGKGFTTNTTMVKTKEAQIAGAQARKQQLEDKYPGLTALKPVVTKGTAPPAIADPLIALHEEMIRADALQAKIEALTNELDEVGRKAMAMSAQEGTILQLQRDRDLEDAASSYYSKRLEESRANDALVGNSNIALVESPTPPGRNTKKLMEIVAGISIGGLGFAFALPFVIELYLNHTLSRPVDIQARLGLPFFITIPEMNGEGGSRRALKRAKKTALLAGKTEAAGEPAVGGELITSAANGHLALWENTHALQPFYDTLRDRLVTFFEMINLTHKPKLVAVTSCGEGAGVTTTAASLASSLSETGEGNVLLVNMNVRDGEAHHFYKGKLACGLDQVLEKETREGALVQGKLYVARELENDDKLPRILPKRFSHLLPKMKASDFDYIIFDMPPVSQISITPRLARFMDMVLLVIESGKTDRDAAKRAADLLVESKANVGVMLNKNRSCVPHRLRHNI